MQYIVYEVWDLQQQKPFYVGKGRNVTEREAQHLKTMRRKKNGAAFHKKLRAMVDAGKPYEFRVVFSSVCESEVFAEEVRLIRQYGRVDLGTGSLLNLTEGGEGSSGRVPTEATRALWSEQRSGKQLPSRSGVTHKNPRAKGGTWSPAQRAAFDALTPEERLRRQEKRRATLLAKAGERSPKQQRAAQEHSEWMKGRRKGPDGKFYSNEDFDKLFQHDEKSKSKQSRIEDSNS